MPNAELAGIYETIRGANDEQAEGAKEPNPAKKAAKKRIEKHEAKVEQLLPGDGTPFRKRRPRAATKDINYNDDKEIDLMPEGQAA